MPEGETVDVGTVLAVIGDAPAGGAPSSGDGAARRRRRRRSAGRRAPARRPTAPPADAAAPADGRPQPGAGSAAGAPPPGPPARAGAGAAPTPSDGNGAGGEGRLLSPIVRRLVNDHGLDIARIEGTGPGGRVTRSDVERAIDAGDGRRRPAPAAAAPPRSLGRPPRSAPAAPPAAPVAAPVAERPPRPWSRSARATPSVPLNRIRRITGDHMVMSKATSPHVLTAMEVDFEGVEQVRRAIGAQWRAEEGSTLTYLPFIARATCDAIRDFPYINASVGDGELIIHGAVNLGHRRRPQLRGPGGTGRARGRTASGCGRSPGRSSTWPTGPAPSGSTPTTWPGARSRSPTRASTGR